MGEGRAFHEEGERKGKKLEERRSRRIRAPIGHLYGEWSKGLD